jgi:hypothetical protein
MTTFVRLVQVAGVTSVLGLAACGGTFRVVRQTPEGGVVALKGDRDDAHAKAEQFMASQCGGGGYAILEEGEAVIGETSHATGVYWGAGVSTGNTSTTQKTEWRISYRCKSAGPAPAPPAGAAPPPPPAASIHTLVIRF